MDLSPGSDELISRVLAAKLTAGIVLQSSTPALFLVLRWCNSGLMLLRQTLIALFVS
ncbi:hypothetical protein BKA56DRAFT_598433 [Ilyonectria sp. MPI-CAGE-AT-0026]|nr:hypothetical protein BKA56DRAFT_598433 [Ilyonectria sp. MPI-CAGE-AT-0026]